MTEQAARLDAFMAEFAAIGSTERATGEKAYLKSDLQFYGVPVPGIRRTVRRFWRQHPLIGRDEVVALVEALWATRWHELRSLGAGLLEVYADRLDVADMALIESCLRQANTWAHVDWLAIKAAGALVERDERAKAHLRRWSTDDSLWVRRASLLALHDGLRAGQGDFPLFCEFAAAMIGEQDFFIRKAIGWVLREVAKKRPALTYGFLEQHIDRVAGLTLREAVKYLPEDERSSLLARHGARSRRGRA